MIERFGIVEALDEGRVCVKLFPESQCASCQTCSTGKPVWFDTVQSNDTLVVGDHVQCSYESSESALAIGLFIVPPLLFFTLFLVIQHVLMVSELTAGLIGVILCSIYIALFAAVVRKRGRERVVTIRKVSHE